MANQSSSNAFLGYCTQPSMESTETPIMSSDINVASFEPQFDYRPYSSQQADPNSFWGADMDNWNPSYQMENPGQIRHDGVDSSGIGVTPPSDVYGSPQKTRVSLDVMNPGTTSTLPDEQCLQILLSRRAEHLETELSSIRSLQNGFAAQHIAEPNFHIGVGGRTPQAAWPNSGLVETPVFPLNEAPIGGQPLFHSFSPHTFEFQGNLVNSGLSGAQPSEAPITEQIASDPFAPDASGTIPDSAPNEWLDVSLDEAPVDWIHLFPDDKLPEDNEMNQHQEINLNSAINLGLDLNPEQEFNPNHQINPDYEMNSNDELGFNNFEDLDYESWCRVMQGISESPEVPEPQLEAQDISGPSKPVEPKPRKSRKNPSNWEKAQCQHPHCFRYFRNKYDLRRHFRRIHLKERNFVCDCGARFFESSELRAHWNIKTPCKRKQPEANGELSQL